MSHVLYFDRAIIGTGMFNPLLEHAKMAADQFQRLILAVKLDAQAAGWRLAHLRNRGSGRLIQPVAVDQSDMVREEMLDDENIAAVRIILLLR